MVEELEHVDVLIVGAGLSGIGAACQLSTECPDKSYAILEARSATGGTWDLFRYPGIRSDSDMFTLGYRFRPWLGDKVLADGPAIRQYMRDTAQEFGVADKIRLNHKVLHSDFCTADQRWTVTIERTDTGEQLQMTCNFLHACAGYYSYDEGFTPEFKGRDRFKGQIIHPQHWPEDLDYSGKRVIVVGSGATAITLVPAMAETAGSITMLQRSPTYILAIPDTDPMVRVLRRVLPAKAVHPIIRWRNVTMSLGIYNLSRKAPGFMRGVIRRGVKARLPEDYPVDVDFNPKYNPWDERLCVVPNGDLFTTIRAGKANIVTDTIDTFTENGILLDSGKELEADIIITATGLNVQMLGGASGSVDGVPIDPSQTVMYKGMMLSGVPNMSMVAGYTNASWTLKADLVSGYLCRLLNYMDEHGYGTATPRVPGPDVGREPMLDLAAGYVQRVIDQIPKQGTKEPWRLRQSYPHDLRMMRYGPVDDEMDFSPKVASTGARSPSSVAA
jgi:cation diffusion facilitator CzcD-associated flavoprotein CzcO